MFIEWLEQNGERVIQESFEKKILPKERRSPGADRVSYQKFLLNKEQEFRTILRQLRNNTYRFSPFLKTEIIEQKFDNKTQNYKLKSRGIIQASIKDSLAQAVILEYLITVVPQKRFYRHSYAYQSKKSPIKAVQAIRKFLCDKYIWIYDADLSKYFDSINHHILLEKIQHYFPNDTHIPTLIQRFIRTGFIPVKSFSNPGSTLVENKIRAVAETREKGIPQGGILSGFLANLFLDAFDKAIDKYRLDVKYLRYADDFIVLGKSLDDILAIQKLIEKELLPVLDLPINSEKTHISCEKSGYHDKTGFEFLGFRFLDGVISVKEANIRRFSTKISTIRVVEKEEGKELKVETYSVRKPKLMPFRKKGVKGICMTKAHWESNHSLKYYVKELERLLTSNIDADYPWEKYSWFDYFFLSNDNKQIAYLDSIMNECLRNFYTSKTGRVAPHDLPQKLSLKSITNRYQRRIKQEVLKRQKRLILAKKKEDVSNSEK